LLAAPPETRTALIGAAISCPSGISTGENIDACRYSNRTMQPASIAVKGLPEKTTYLQRGEQKRGDRGGRANQRNKVNEIAVGTGIADCPPRGPCGSGLRPPTCGLAEPPGVSEVSRFSRMKFLCVSGVFDYAGLNRSSRYRACSCCLPRIRRTSASGLHLFGAEYPPRLSSVYH
jgi:hypothetical protein